MYVTSHLAVFSELSTIEEGSSLVMNDDDSCLQHAKSINTMPVHIYIHPPP
jgi:hypothetical protein